MNPEKILRRVYLLKSTEFSPEVMAVAFAKTSRDPRSFDEIAKSLTVEKSSKFHQKWVIGYGHSSVAEHAILHIAVESISRLACEVVESCRLASYTEKSSRYQIFNKNNYYNPKCLKKNNNYYNIYQFTINQLFTLYAKSIDPIKSLIRNTTVKKPDETQTEYESRIHTNYIDNCRYLLPSATLTNVGITINARSLEHTITKLLSHPLSEVNQIGSEIKNISQAELPTLLRHANYNQFLNPNKLTLIINNLPISTKITQYDSIEFVNCPTEDEAIVSICTAFLIKYSHYSSFEAERYLHTLSRIERFNLIQAVFSEMGIFDKPIRELEHVFFTIECVMDQGAYYDIKRHRMMTQSPQKLGISLGYSMPLSFEKVNLHKEFQQCMENVITAYKTISEAYPTEADYLLPNAFRRRLLMSLNFRELVTMTKLRISENGHFAYRAFTIHLLEKFKEHYPLLGKLLPVVDESYQSFTSKFFSKGYE